METPEPFNSDTVALVDEISVAGGTNYIFRGNNPYVPPENSISFAYSSSSMETTFQKSVAVLSSLNDYCLIDVCLLDNTGEIESWISEMNSFGVDYETDFPSTDPNGYSPTEPPYDQTSPPWNPGQQLGSGQVIQQYQGNLVWWPLQPGHDVSGSNGYNYPGLIQYFSQLRTAAVEPNTNGNVIYFHCMNGYDRTGAVHLAYLMTYGNGLNGQKYAPMSLSDACSIADYCTPESNGTNAKPPALAYQTMVTDYCTQNLGRSSTQCQPCSDWST